MGARRDLSGWDAASVRIRREGNDERSGFGEGEREI